MSEQHQPDIDEILNLRFAVLIFILILGVLAAEVFSNSPRAWPASDATQEVALVEPTQTDVPPTTTPPPMPTPTFTSTPAPTSTPLPPATATPLPATSTPESVSNAGAAEITGAGYDPALVERGEQLFLLCAACHGADARGLPNLGKDLVDSDFVASQTDDELTQFIITGRPIWDPLNTTGIDMPGRGGNPALTTEEIQAIIAYIRTLAAENSGQGEAVPVDSTPVADASANNAPAPAADGASTAYDPALIAAGQALFPQCAACHGADARGLPNLGKNLVDSEFVAGLTDQELLEFVRTGRPIWDPLNTTGIDMPGRGGNPALTDDDILAIIAYVRSLAASSG